MTVLPSGVTEVLGPTLDSHSGKIVGYGTLSEYRPDENAVNLSIETGSCAIVIRDNIAVVELEVDTPTIAYSVSVEFVDKFLAHLSISRGTLFSHTPYILESEDQKL